jgi:hypothetical protein
MNRRGLLTLLGLAPAAAIAPKLGAAAPTMPEPPDPAGDWWTKSNVTTLVQPETKKTYRYLGLAPLKNEGGSYSPLYPEEDES